jgi:hypothetical protein
MWSDSGRCPTTRGAWSSWRALAEVLGGNGAPGRTVAPDPDEVEVRVVALMMAEGLVQPG